jgi:diguanylate cyclase
MKQPDLITSIADYIPGLVAVYNIQTGQYLFVNKSITKILGYQPEDFINGGFTFVASLIHPDDISDIMAKNALALDAANQNVDSPLNDPIASFEYRMKHKNGRWIWLQTEGSIFKRDTQGKVELILNVSLNISDRKIKETQLENLKIEFEKRLEKQTAELQERERMFRSLTEVVEDYAIFHLDPKGYVTSWNEGIGKILGYSEPEVLGQHMSLFFLPDDVKNNLPMMELESAAGQGAAIHEGLRIRKDGTTFSAVTTTTAIKNEKNELLGFSKIIRDVTELKEAEETIRYHAMHDTLTGLANRKALDEFFQVAKSMTIRHGHKMALIFLDLDRFKTINDTLGHGIGDLILKEIAYRLKNAVRKEDVVARLGGDEFIILINEVHNPSNVVKVAEKIMNALAPVTRVGDHSLHVTASMGVALFPTDGQDIYNLLKNADTALYRAKDAGRNRYQFYDYSMNLQSVSALSLEQDLRTALSKNQFFIEYQPFIEIKTGKVLGVEALVRWKHPTLGVVQPFDFIPLAEETGMIVPIGKWILETVCKEGKTLEQLGHNLTMTVNLSARQFSESNLVDTITEIFRRVDFNPRNLEIEITESVAMENIARTSSKLNDLKDHGIAIAIDDFGTGYSSLSYLKRFPVQKLKIDKSFVKHAITDAQDSTIIRAIISMSQSLGLTVCAEGVEDKEQLALLESMDCDIAQGFYFSKPIPAEQLSEWLQARKED